LPIISAREIRRSYGLRTILESASVSIEPGEKVGLVGRNGAGKSTLCRILAGLEEADGGDVVRRRDLRMAYLEQEPAMDGERSAREIVLSGLGGWQEAVDEHGSVSLQLEHCTDDSQLDRLLQAQTEAAATVESRGGWDLDHQAEAVLGNLGIFAVDQQVGTMSGGERRRVALARLLVSGPEFAIIDEPTNHLDIPTIEWLETWFQERFEGALLLVTHDRYLLDRVVTRTIEVDEGRLHIYRGGWEAYLVGKAERSAHAARTESNRQNFLRRELEWLRRQPKARTTKSKSRVDRAESAMSVSKPQQEKYASIEMGALRSGRTILEVDDLVVTIGDRRLVDGLTLRLCKGQRIGIVGPNGCGKTTLLRTLMGERPPCGGSVQRAKNSTIAYLDQNRSGLKPEQTVAEQVGEGRSVVTLGSVEMTVRAYLERFLFDRHEQTKKIGKLSGGERARVGLALALRDASQLIIFDEPTNDLDGATLAALEDALLEYEGAALVVTHDRRFLDRVATSLLVFDEGGGLTLHAGNYADYLIRRREEKPAKTSVIRKTDASPVASVAEKTSVEGPDVGRKMTYAEGIELKGIMAKIEAAEVHVGAMETELEASGFYDRERRDQADFLKRLEVARSLARELVGRWETLEGIREGQSEV